MRHRTSNYARVMLTSYGPKRWDVGDAYGTLQRQHTLPGGLRGQRIANDTKDNQDTNQDTNQEPRNDMLWGLVAVACVLGLAYFARGSR